MGGSLGGGDPSGGGGVDSNVGLARMAQQMPGLGGILGQMGYAGPSGPQQPVGTGGSSLTPGQQSGLADITGYGKNLMAGQPLGTGAPTAAGGGAKPAAMPSLMPAAWQPQVGAMQGIQNPYATMSSPGSAQPNAAGGMNPQFFPMFRR